MNLKKGRLIAFEGGEGAGKTTVLNKIAQLLMMDEFEVVKTREPGATALGEEIRSLLLESGRALTISNKSELLLFLAARAQNLEEIIRPALERGAWVLCDRFNDSTIAYQGWARGIGIAEVENLCSWVCGDIVPDLTFYLKVDPAVGLERTQNVSQLDRIEAERGEFHLKVEEGFRQIALLHPDHFTFIDASRSMGEVASDVWNVLDSHYGKELRKI